MSIVNRMTAALLIVDAQLNMFEPEPAHDAAKLLRRLVELVAAARCSGVPVVFVRNNGEEGQPDVPDSPGWHIHPTLPQLPGELVIDKWESDSFSVPELRDWADASGVDEVVVAGLQSEYCITATCEGAVDLGLNVTLVSNAHSTFDDELPAAVIVDATNDSLASTASLRSTRDVMRGWETSS